MLRERSVEYKGRPEYFSMYTCIYAMIKCSLQWLQEHEVEV